MEGYLPAIERGKVNNQFDRTLIPLNALRIRTEFGDAVARSGKLSIAEKLDARLKKWNCAALGTIKGKLKSGIDSYLDGLLERYNSGLRDVLFPYLGRDPGRFQALVRDDLRRVEANETENFFEEQHSSRFLGTVAVAECVGAITAEWSLAGLNGDRSDKDPSDGKNPKKGSIFPGAYALGGSGDNSFEVPDWTAEQVDAILGNGGN